MTCNFKDSNYNLTKQIVELDLILCFTIQRICKQATRARMSTWPEFSVAHMFSEGFEQSMTTVPA